jgi:hypothetical protein
MRTQRADGGWSDRADAPSWPAGRTSSRRRDPLLPGMLLPVVALAQYAASPTAAAGLNNGAGAGAGEDRASQYEASEYETGVAAVLAGHSAPNAQPPAIA